jgi:ribosomal protein S24E
MPELERADVQEFIKEFQSEVKKDKPISKQEIKQQIIEEKKESQELISIKNEYESKLLQKDLEIRKRDELINSIRKMLGVSEQNLVVSNIQSSNLEMWFSKLGNGMPTNILKFLAEKSGLKFSKSQIALGTGYAVNGGSFSNALSLLRRNLLIKQDGEFIQINPDL